MTRTLPLLALGLALAAAVRPAQAQRGEVATLVVHVVDEKAAPLPGAYVTVAGARFGATTDAAGQARVSNVPLGNRLVIVSRQGYAYDRRPGVFQPGGTVQLEVAMRPAPVELEGITVTTQGRNMDLVRNGFYDRQKQGIGAFMTRQRLDDLRPFRTADAFRYMRGFTVQSFGARNVVVSNRRGMGCIPKVYIDGAEMFARSPREQSDALDMLRPDDIEAIEAYAGAAEVPAEYSLTGNICGVIVLWTRH